MAPNLALSCLHREWQLGERRMAKPSIEPRNVKQIGFGQEIYLVAPADAQIMYTLNDVHFPSVGSGYGVLYQPGAIVVTREWMDHCFPGATRLDVKAIAFSKKQMPS